MGNADKMRTTPSNNAGASFTRLLDSKKMARDYKYYKFVEGINRLAILPYTVTSKVHPLLHSNKLEKGDLFYNFDVYVHKNVGAKKGEYLCPRRNYGKPCPICEAADDYQKKEGRNSESAKALWPKRRIFYNILDINNLEEGVQILDANNMDFQEPLEAAQLVADNDPDIQEVAPGAYFAMIENGLTVKVTGIMKDWSVGGKSGESVRASGITLSARRKNEDVSKFADDVILFDKVASVLSYEELEAIFVGGDDDEDEAPAPKKEAPVEEAPKAKKPPVEEEEEAPKAKKEPVEEETKKCPSGYKFGDAFSADHKECDDCPSKLYSECAKAGRAAK